MANRIETKFCTSCNEYNEVDEYCTESVGQHGRIVVAHIYCTVCDEEIRSILVDKDI